MRTKHAIGDRYAKQSGAGRVVYELSEFRDNGKPVLRQVTANGQLLDCRHWESVKRLVATYTPVDRDSVSDPATYTDAARRA